MIADMFSKKITQFFNKQPTVLVADSDEIQRDILTRRLYPLGCVINLACNADQALSMLHEQHFDLLMLDLNLSGKDGIAVLQELKSEAKFKTLPIIMMIGSHYDLSRARYSIHMGAADFLLKPLKPQSLKDSVVSCLPDFFISRAIGM